MLKPFFQSLKDRIHQLDIFITRIRNSFIEMIKTMTKYVKYFLRIAFKSSKYFFALFILIFTIIFFLSKEKKGNLYVLLYFFIGYMMFNLLLSILNLMINIMKLLFRSISLFHQSTENDRPKRQRVSKAVAGIVNCIIILGLILAIVCIFFVLSFLYSIEIHLFDIINELFRGKTL